MGGYIYYNLASVTLTLTNDPFYFIFNLFVDVFSPEPIFILQDMGEEDDVYPTTQPRNLLPTENSICIMTVDEDV